MNTFLVSLLVALDLTGTCETKCYIHENDVQHFVSMNYVSEVGTKDRFICNPIFFRRIHSDTLIIYVDGVDHYAVKTDCMSSKFISLECPELTFEIDIRNFHIWILFWERKIKLSQNTMI